MKIQISKIIGAFTGVAVAAACITPFYIPDDSLLVSAVEPVETETYPDYATAGEYFAIDLKNKLAQLYADADATDLGALQVLSAQQLFYNVLSGYYENQIPPSTSLTSYIIQYNIAGDNSTYYGSAFYPYYNGSVIFSSPHFQITLGWTNTDYIPTASERRFTNPYQQPGDSGYIGYSMSQAQNFVARDNAGFFTNYTSPAYTSFFYNTNGYGVPTLTQGTSLGSISQFGLSRSATSSLPSGNIDTTFPWDYYNNTLIPALLHDYPDNSSYLAFPDGYNGDPEPTESTDPNLPTSPTIDFTIPTADYSPLDPSEVLNDYSMSSSFWWDLTSDILDNTGLKSLALFGYSLAIIGYFVWKLGR